ncbi:MAG TPA: hypothetical protein VGC63_04880 [Solirubrobacterales bacterium]|jgi:hypothetical protein
MALLLKVGERDFSAFIRVAHEDGLDPANSEYSEPQFSGAPAFSEGQSFVGDAVGNRLQSYPLILKAANTDALYQLARDINGELKKGEQVEYRSGGASQSTFFDLERGRLEVTYEYWLDQAARARCMLHLWTRPYGHAGTTRAIAAATGTGAFVTSATGIGGDHSAQAVIGIRLASYATESGFLSPLIGYGVKYPVPSGWEPVYRPAQMASPRGMVAATIVGASGRTASQYKAWKVAATGPDPAAIGDGEPLTYLPLRPQDSGRYRLFGGVRHFIRKLPPNLSGLYWACGDSGAGGTGMVALASVVTQRWQILDFGEISVASFGATKAESVLNDPGGIGVSIFYVGASGATAIATYPIQIESLWTVPIDQVAGLVVEDHSTLRRSDNWRWEMDSIRKTVTRYSGVGSFVASGAPLRDLTAVFRGNLPSLPPVGSPAASGGAAVFIFGGDRAGDEDDDFVGNRPISVDIAIRERFSYLR